MTIRRSTVLLVLALGMGTAGASQPPTVTDELWAKIDPATCTGTCTTTLVPVLIRLVDQADLSTIAGRTQAERQPAVVAALKQKAADTQDLASGCTPGLLTYLAQQGSAVSHVTSLWLVNAVAARATPAVITAVAGRADVSEVSFDGDHPGPLVSGGSGGASAAALTAPANLTNIRVPTVWAAGITGACPSGVSGVCAKVGVISTGADATHPALAGNLLHKADNTPLWLDGLAGVTASICLPGQESVCPAGAPAPCDCVGEGTHLTGVAVGTANSIGVAPGAQWLGCRAEFVGTDGRLHADDVAMAACLHYLMDPEGNGSVTYAANIIVIPSWKLPGRADRQFVDQIRSLRAAGILPVVAAGHDEFSALPPDCGTVTDPLQCGLPSMANYPETVSVGASDNNSPPQLLATSFRGLASVGALGEAVCTGGQTTGCVTPQMGPRLYAPGINVSSAWPGGTYQVLTYNPEGVAAAHVAGVAALIYGQYAPNSAPPVDYIDHALQRSAEGFVAGTAAPPYVPGELDAPGAVEFEDAELVTEQDPPDNQQALTIVPASVAMRNTGVVPWQPATHKLDAVTPIGTNQCGQTQDWGTTRLTMSETTARQPGDVADFPFPILPGATAPGARVPLPVGPYLFQWQMRHLGRPFALPELFGANSAAVSRNTFGVDGIGGSIGTPTVPTSLGQVCTPVTLTFTNTGTSTWSPAHYRVKQIAGAGVLTGGYANLSANVCAGGVANFTVTLCVPYVTGTYSWSFQMEKDGALIGPVISRSVFVPAVDNAGSGALTTISCGFSFCNLQLTVTNTGSTTWNQNYCVVAVEDPQGCCEYPPASQVHLPACLNAGETIPPGATRVFANRPDGSATIIGELGHTTNVQMRNAASQVFGSIFRWSPCSVPGPCS